MGNGAPHASLAAGEGAAASLRGANGQAPRSAGPSKGAGPGNGTGPGKGASPAPVGTPGATKPRPGVRQASLGAFLSRLRSEGS